MTRRHARGAAPRGERAARDRWLVSYADFITLLFAFFTTLYAVSTVDAGKLSTVARGLQRAFDTPRPMVAGDPPAPRGGVLTGGRGLEPLPLQDARAEIARALSDDLRVGRLELSQDGRGLILSIPEAGAFPIGSADLAPATEEAIGRLAVALGHVPHPVRVEGHTDDVPIHTSRFASNWDLSAARAIRVVELLIDRGGLSPDRLSAAGYAEFHPRVTNDSPAARGRNRRVDVIVLAEAP